MGRIHLLDDDVINKIAAGEVVERPASVVKELVENAIDAGATTVDIALELGGSRSIAVTDNGSGMSPEDAPAALRRHATSKITSADDLFNVRTMGFRGEALASVASISRFSLATTERGAQDGVKITIAGGEAPMTWPWNGPAGTMIVVENLFYNVPARAKFMKAPATELSHCLELVQAFSLCHPGIGFTLRHNGREHFRAPPVPAGDEAPWLGEAALRERARAVLGKDVATFQYVRSSSRHGDLEALLSPPGVEKATGKHLHTFVNGRWVKDKVLRYGTLRGYHSHLLKGRFPAVVLHLRVDPALVDVNVHPAKTEVRFQYPDEIQSLLALALREKLRDAGWAAPAALPDFGPGPSPRRAPEPQPMAAPAPAATLAGPGRGRAGESFQASPVGRAAGGGSTERRLLPRSEDLAGAARPASMGGQVVHSTRSFSGARAGGAPLAPWAADPVTDKASIDAMLAGLVPADEGGRAAATATPLPAGSAQDLDGKTLEALPAEAPIPWDDLQLLGAFDKCYLLFATEGRLLALDQHAFHERILYERLLRDETLLTRSQPLLVPEAIELSPEEVATLRSRRSHLEVRGFDYQMEGDTTVLIRAVPAILASRDLGDLFADLARDWAGEGDGGGLEPTDSNGEMARLILAKTACHAAVRAGEELPENELKQLLSEARTVDFYHNCPHGRRVFRWWSRGQVARWFDR